MESAEHKATKPSKNNNEHVQLKKGDVDKALNDASLVKIEQTYETPTRNP